MTPTSSLSVFEGRLGFASRETVLGDLQSVDGQNSLEASAPLEAPPTPVIETSLSAQSNSSDTSSNINTTTPKITSRSLKDDKDFQRRMHIAEVVEKYIKQVYPHMLNPPEAAKLDNRHPWEVKNDRYKEFIEFFKQYEHDRKRVSYN